MEYDRVIESIAEKFKNAQTLLNQDKIDKATQRIKAAWDLINKNKITDPKSIIKFISDTATIYITIAAKKRGPAVFEENLAQFLNLVPKDNQITLYSIAVFKQHLSLEYMNSASLDYNKALDNAVDALKIMQEHFPDKAKDDSQMTQNLFKIIGQINSNQTMVHFKAGDFTEMLASAKMIYDAISEVLSVHVIKSEMAQQVGLAYNELKQYKEALSYLEEAMNIYKNNNMKADNPKVIALEKYKNDVVSKISLANAPVNELENSYNAGFEFFKAGDLKSGFTKINEVFTKLQANAQLTDPLADKSMNLLISVIQKINMTIDDKTYLQKYALDTSIAMKNAGNVNGSSYVVLTSSLVNQHIVPLLINAKKFDEAIALSQKVYDAVSKFQTAPLYKAALGTNYISASKCTEGVPLLNEALIEMQKIDFKDKNKVIADIQVSINSCSMPVYNQNSAVEDMKAIVKTCNDLGFTDLEVCRDKLLGDSAEITI